MFKKKHQPKYKQESPIQTRSYRVLYYKRSNRVHKGKGVSKLDGILTIFAPPKAQLILYDAAVLNCMTSNANKKSYIVSTSINWEISKRVADNVCLEDDEHVTLPKWEVEVDSEVMMDDNEEKVNSKAVEVDSDNKGKGNKCSSGLLGVKNRKNGCVRLRGIKRQLPSLSNSKFIKRSSSDQTNRARPVPCRSSSSGSNERLSKRTIPINQKIDVMKKATSSNCLVKELNSSSTSKPLICGSGESESFYSNHDTSCNVEQKKISRSKASDRTTISSECNFPSAIGHIVVPPSVNKILQPHQREGIAFLWNIFTGNVKSHILCNDFFDEDPTRKESFPCEGAILADEMGLGKSLMTIALIFALYRLKKDQRFIIVCPSSL